MKKHQNFKKLIRANGNQKQTNFKTYRYLICTFFIFFSFFVMNGQSIPCGGTTTLSSIQSITPNCTYTSSAYTNSYALQSYYIPSSGSPLITVKVVLHVFTDNSGSGNWENTSSTYNGVPALYTLFSALQNQTDRYSDPRIASYTVTGFNPTYISDSKTRYELTKVYFYPNTTLYGTNPYYSSGATAFFNYFSTYYPTRLDEGLPIIINGNCTAHQTGGPNGAPLVFTSFGPGGLNFPRSHLRHEIGHCFGLLHCYYGCPYSAAPEDINCNTTVNPDFLSDVFPTNNSNCNPVYNAACFPNPASSPCFVCHEDDQPTPYINVRSNNLMDNKDTNTWMSPLQMARRRRCMYLRPIRMYAKDTTSDHVNVRNITSSQTWDFDIQMYEDIVVKAGNTLTIKCKVAMAIGGKIKVERGAKLVLDGGEITGWCKSGPWTGIEVEGLSTQNQNFSGGYGVYQGYVNIINGGILSNANIAVSTGTTDASGTFDWGSTGGIIIASDGNFINNVKDVQYMYYHSSTGGNLGSFTRCNFKTNSALIAGGIPDTRVSLYEVDGVKFFGNSFEYNAGSTYTVGSRGIGISSIDASYTIDQICNSGSPCSSYTRNHFSNFTHGIYVNNTNALRVVSVTNTDFFDNYQYSTYINVMNTPVFTDNYVRTKGLNGAGVGLYLNSCKYYNVKNNTFLENSSGSAQTDVGIYINNSQAGAHKIYRNSFANFGGAIIAINNNSGLTNTTDGLKMNCNDFTPVANAYDIGLTNTGTITPTVMKDQGIVTSDFKSLVRNKYAAASTCTNCENKWYIVGTSGKIINHPANSDANTRPTPQPANSDYSVNVTNSGHALNYTLECTPTETTSGGGGSGGGGRLANINTTIGNLTSNNTTNDKNSDQQKSNLNLFDLQAAVAEKLNYFLLDSLPTSKDSVIALLQSNPGGMRDADVQLTNAYINKGDLTHAYQNAMALAITKPDWSALQLKLIALHQNNQKAMGLQTDGTSKSFLENYVLNDQKDGVGAANSILKFATGKNYFIPHPLPYVENGINKSINNSAADESVVNPEFSVYPNPTNSFINIIYKGKSDNPIHIILTNTLGKKVHEATISSNRLLEIDATAFVSGVYMLTAYEGKTMLYQTKVICIK